MGTPGGRYGAWYVAAGVGVAVALRFGRLLRVFLESFVACHDDAMLHFSVHNVKHIKQMVTHQETRW